MCQVTSQHPYCEEFIGAPHVYTIDVNVLSDVEKVIKEILLKEVFWNYLFILFLLFFFVLLRVTKEAHSPKLQGPVSRKSRQLFVSEIKYSNQNTMNKSAGPG